MTRPSMKPVDRGQPYGLNSWNVIMDRRVKPGDGELWGSYWMFRRRATGARLLPLDLGDLVGLGAAGRHHLDGLAFLFVDQRARDRRRDRDSAMLGVRLRLT